MKKTKNNFLNAGQAGVGTTATKEHRRIFQGGEKQNRVAGTKTRGGGSVISTTTLSRKLDIVTKINQLHRGEGFAME